MPELADLIGAQPPGAEPSALEAQHRSLATLQALIEALATGESPLVRFLDDMQWSDAATLALLRRLVEGEAGLLIVCAWRDDAPATGPAPAGAVAALCEQPGVTCVRLEPLDLDTLTGLLAEAVGWGVEATMEALWPAIGAGLVALADETPLVRSPDGEAAAPVRAHFLHDRVRQAAYALNSEPARQAMHWQIGRALLARTPAALRAARACEIARQLNAGRAMLEAGPEWLELVELNVAAARMAKDAAAYPEALGFARVARELLGARGWEAHPDLDFEAGKLHAACAGHCGELAEAEAEAMYVELLARARGPLEAAELHAMRAGQRIFDDRMDEAVAEGAQALRLLGFRLKARPTKAGVLRELVATKLAQGSRTVETLERAAPLDDARIRLAMRVLADLIVPAYLGGKAELFAVVSLVQARLSLRHGHGHESPSAYASYAVLLAGLGDHDGAYAFGRLALRLAESLGVADSQCRTLVLYALFSHSWSQPWSTLDDWLAASVEADRRSGDMLFMAYAAGFMHLWNPGLDLGAAIAGGRAQLAVIRRAGYQNALDAASLAQQCRLALRGETSGPLSLSDASFDEHACLARMRRVRYACGVAIYQLNRLQLACIAGSWDTAWAALREGEPVAETLAGSPYMVDWCVFDFQAAIQQAVERGPAAGRARALARRFHRRMRGWARRCPENFAHHEALMEAELARLAFDGSRAPKLYEQAIDASRMSGFLRDEARANEAAARYFGESAMPRVAKVFLLDARDAYRRGALSPR